MCLFGEIARFQPNNTNIQMATKSTVLKKSHYKNQLGNRPIISHSKNVIFEWVEMPDFREGQLEKYGQNWNNCHFFQRNQGQFFEFSLE